MTLSLADMEVNRQASQHRDPWPSQIIKYEERVLSAIDTINGFMNPFTEENEALFCISSGALTPIEIEKDVLGAECIGQEARQRFVDDRLKQQKDFLWTD